MNGDLTRQKEMTEARVRMGENQKTANEQGAVAARRTDEMQQAAAQRLAEARQAGRKAVIAEDAAAREAMLDDREARMQAIDNEIAQLDARSRRRKKNSTRRRRAIRKRKPWEWTRKRLASSTRG